MDTPTASDAESERDFQIKMQLAELAWKRGDREEAEEWARKARASRAEFRLSQIGE